MKAKRRPTPVPAPPSETFTIDTGTARIEAAREDGASWTLYVNEQPSSPYHWGEPSRLDFPYLRTMRTVIAHQMADLGTPWHALHVGGAACALPRALSHEYPASRHLVVEVDGALNELVRRHLDLPRSPLLKLRTGDGLAVLAERREASSQVIVRDAFAGAQTPAHLAGLEFFAQAKRVLTGDGVLLLNIATQSPRSRLTDELDQLAALFHHVGAIGEQAVFRGKRDSNVVAFASTADLPIDALEHAFRGGELKVRLHR